MQTPMQHAAATGKRRRLSSLLVIIVVILAGSYGVRAFVTRTRVPTSAGAAGWTTYHDPTNGWTMQFPAGWHARGIKDYLDQWQRDAAAWGILVTNLDTDIPKLRGVGAFNFRGQPASFVAVKIVAGPGYWGPPCKDSPTPFSRLRAKRTTTVTGENGTPQLALEMNFTSHGNVYRLEALIGSRASRADVDRLDRMVASISFADAKRAKIERGTSCADE